MCDSAAAEDCSICLEVLRAAPAADVTRTGCGHRFHADCLGKWEALGNGGCPLCRAPLAPPPPGPASDAFGGPTRPGLTRVAPPAPPAPPGSARGPAPSATLGVVVSSVVAVVSWIVSDDFIVQLAGPPRPSGRPAAARVAAARDRAQAAAARAATARAVASAIAAGAEARR